MTATALLERLPPLLLPDDAALKGRGVAHVEPQCTPPADIEGICSQLVSTRVPAELLRSQAEAPSPGDVAFVGALVQALLPRTDLVIDGDAHLTRDSSVYPARGGAVVPGALRVRGALAVSAPLVVCGDLVVDGVLSDCGPQSVVVVLGSLQCRALRTSGEVLVAGDLVATAFVHGRDNDNVLEVHGALRTPVLMSDDHAVETGSLVVEHRPPMRGVWGPDIFDLGAAHVAALVALADPACVQNDDLDLEQLALSTSPWDTRHHVTS
jgi:hypothetical protein